MAITRKRKPRARPLDLKFHAGQLGCTAGHLSQVLAGKRQSASLLARFYELQVASKRHLSPDQIWAATEMRKLRLRSELSLKAFAKLVGLDRTKLETTERFTTPWSEVDLEHALVAISGHLAESLLHTQTLTRELQKRKIIKIPPVKYAKES